MTYLECMTRDSEVIFYFLNFVSSQNWTNKQTKMERAYYYSWQLEHRVLPLETKKLFHIWHGVPTQESIQTYKLFSFTFICPKLYGSGWILWKLIGCISPIMNLEGLYWKSSFFFTWGRSKIMIISVKIRSMYISPSSNSIYRITLNLLLLLWLFHTDIYWSCPIP